jgi:membrane associated rhomboid family serine protease
MIPLRDVIPSRTVPVVTVALIAGHAAVFALERLLETDRLLAALGVLPAPLALAAFVASTFPHSGLLPVAGTMLYLWIFGPTVEDRLGHARFLTFYLLCGAAATAVHVAFSPALPPPVAGGGGALAGAMGAYFVLYPNSKIVTLVPLPFAIRLAEVPAAVFAGFWALAHVATLARTPGAAGVAFGGLLAGLAAGTCGVFLFRRPERQRVDWWDPAPPG